ncbi:MAG: TetR/AcrR family transcriptional regulator [Actinobacteria bacterium]|jgi:AcrR family transcriptional regulator|nr:TetR/AcrR family transcriptional regulator [Actinomycetota bacterium]
MSVADERLNVRDASAHALAPSIRRQATRDRLLEAAADVFREAGLQGASVEAVCSRAGFTRGAFYSNFESKEQLFLTLLEREFERRTRHLHEQAATLEPELRERGPSLEPPTVANYIVEFFMPETDATTWIVLETEFLLLAMRDPAIASGYRDFMQRFYAEIAEAITHIIGAANRRFVLPPEHATFVLSGVYEREIKAAALSGNPTIGSYEGLGHQLAELLFAITEPLPAP